MCGRYYIAEDDVTEEMARIIEEINRKKTPEGMKNLRRGFSIRHSTRTCE